MATHFAEQFNALNQFLQATRPYWQCVAFSQPAIPWAELRAPLLALSDEQVAELEANPEQLNQFFQPFIPQLAQLAKLTALNNLTEQPSATSAFHYPFWLTNGIKGRKIEQLHAFVDQLSCEGQRVVEWCAGKGHLGRLLAYRYQSQVHSIELQQSLCEQGEQAAKKQQLSVKFTQADVLEQDCQGSLAKCQHAIALHACGGLHQQLMRQGVKTGVAKLSIAPCCYHLFNESDVYQPMSDVAKQSGLLLTSSDLKLALQETVTAGARVTRLRKTEVQWRLGLDALMRDILGHQHYISVPSVGKKLFSQSFADFCYWAAEKKSFSIAKNTHFAHYLALGEQRKTVTDRIELVRHLFRRAIEVWLILDRAIYLQQFNYHVEVGEFCQKHITPRNILIQASLKNKGL